jgi:FkbM family methyltransferase
MPPVKQLLRRILPRGLRNVLRAPGKSLRWGWHRLRFALGARQTVAIRPGWSLVCHPLAYRHSYVAQQTDPEQVAEFDAFLAACTPGMTLLDIGAHFGLFSLAALHHGGPEARALAVDASPTAVEMVRVQAALNGVADRLQVVQACVCDQPAGVRGMVAVGVLADGYFAAPAEHHTARDLTSVRVVTLDQLVDRGGFRPSHIKIDVEGFEGQVLKGGEKVLTGCPAPLLFLELHNRLIRERGEDPAEVLGLLDRFGYTLCDPAGAPLGRHTLLARPLVRVSARRARETAGCRYALPPAEVNP